jgi:putative CocE/NonD family hydrolase
MAGGSYNGATQFLAAAVCPTGLAAIAPLFSSDGYFEKWTYYGGVPQLGLIATWSYALAVSSVDLEGDRDVETARCYDELRDVLQSPIDAIARLKASRTVQRYAPYVLEWLRHPTLDEYWRRWETGGRVDVLRLPTLQIAGWFDPFLPRALTHHRAAERLHDAEGQDAPSHLVIGPWVHGTSLSGLYRDRDFGPLADAAAAGVQEQQLGFFRYYLTKSGRQPPPVRVFVMGPDRWRDEDTWPPRAARTFILHLHSGGAANTTRGDGRLTPEKPDAESLPDRFVYDPYDPVRTAGGATVLPGLDLAVEAGPVAQHQAERRRDILVYTSPPFSAPLELAGDIAVTIFVSTTAGDADWCAKLLHVRPDGTSLGLLDGIARADYGRLTGSVATGQPGVEEHRVHLGATSYVVPAGHRVRLEVTSSNFPRFAPNLGTSYRSDGGCQAPTVAVHQLFHDARNPSCVALTVIGDAAVIGSPRTTSARVAPPSH